MGSTLTIPISEQAPLNGEEYVKKYLLACSWFTPRVRADAAEIGKAFELLKIEFEDCLTGERIRKNSLAFVGNPGEVGAWRYWLKKADVAEQMKDYFGID